LIACEAVNATKTANELHQEKLIDADVRQRIEDFETKKLFSLYYPQRMLLYAGVTILASGLGILIYKNIEYIGHNLVVALIGLISAACFAYCAWKRDEFEWTKVDAPNKWYDYILLLGALTLISFIGYLQFEFNVFGTQWGLATFIPFIILAFAAYFYDHLGLLSMAIVLFASWLGIAITPYELLSKNDFSADRFIYTGTALGIFLTLVSVASERYKLKEHFAFTYFNFGLHAAFVAALNGLFTQHIDWLWVMLISGFVAYCVYYALHRKSFYVLLCAFLYGYITLSYLALQLINKIDTGGIGDLYFIFFYFIFSSIMVIK
jgi:hypothetical protein